VTQPDPDPLTVLEDLPIGHPRYLTSARLLADLLDYDDGYNGRRLRPVLGQMTTAGRWLQTPRGQELHRRLIVGRRPHPVAGRSSRKPGLLGIVLVVLTAGVIGFIGALVTVTTIAAVAAPRSAQTTELAPSRDASGMLELSSAGLTRAPYAPPSAGGRSCDPRSTSAPSRVESSSRPAATSSGISNRG
jgi:hypothetical protein